MSSTENTIKQCCKSDPTWIFLYSDGNIIAVCNMDFRSTSYQLGVEKIINIESQEEFTAEQMFGGKIGKL